nr:MAG TPA: hypothetical protein [Crassvirales sp.]
MKKLYCKHIPFKGYLCMTILWWLVIRSEYKNKITETVERHETVHSYQQVVLFLFSLIVSIILSLTTNYSWWCLLLTPIIPLIAYIISWIIEIILPPYNRAYKDICFEGEARALESNEDYKKKLFPFSFLKYIPNKKYGGR